MGEGQSRATADSGSREIAADRTRPGAPWLILSALARRVAASKCESSAGAWLSRFLAANGLGSDLTMGSQIVGPGWKNLIDFVQRSVQCLSEFFL